MRAKESPLRELMIKVNKEAINLNHKIVGLEHLLLALVKTGGLESRALTYAGANYDLLRSYLIKRKSIGEDKVTSPEVSKDMKELMEKVNQQMIRDRDMKHFGEYFLYNLLWSDSLASDMLRATNVDPQEVFDLLVNFRKQRENKSNNRHKSNLERFGKDLTNLDLNKIDGVVGREEEIDRIIQVLTRRSKNNPVLIGEAGVGKTAIVEGLAKRISEDKVPDVIRNKKIISIDMAQIVAGTKYRGDFEKRISDTLEEASENPDVILFIDEIHTIIGAGSSEGGLDASNIMKPYLTKGDIKLIGATTISEYRKNIEKEPALERRMQPIMIDEPSIEETIDIIKGIKKHYEDFHRVSISDEVIDRAVTLSDRYLIDRFLPDKAIDIIDEAASKVKVKNYVIPDEVKEMEDEIKGYEKEKIRAINTQNFEQAAYLRDQIIDLQTKINEFYLGEDKSQDFISQITVNQILEIVSDWSQVPITELTEKESEKYLDLDKKLKMSVIGQDEAIDSVSKAIKRARVGLKKDDSPIGTFIFVGPTGVGKTYLAKSLAEELFGDKDDLIRIDMSEYMERHNVSKLIGSPPGYVGYEEGGQLTEAVRNNPYSVILFDEIEKAHPDVFNILLQILDEGRLTDSQGTEIDFKDTVIILTSNAGASRLENANKIGFASEDNKDAREYENIKSIINEELKNLFKPEFLNRIDDIIVFNKLGKEEVKEIAKLKLDDLISRMEEMGYDSKYTDRLAHYISEKGFDTNYGARPLDRAIKTEVEDLIANSILSEQIKKDDKIRIGIRNNNVYVEAIK